MANRVLFQSGRSKFGSLLYYALNSLLAISVLFLIVVTNSWILAIILTIVSKWRVFTVRPNYWWANIKANLVDFIVGISFVFLIYYAGTTETIGLMDINWLGGNNISFAQILLTALYAFWLLWLKVRSITWAVNLQALVALFLGLTVFGNMLATEDSIFLVIVAFIVGFGAARHALMNIEGDTGSLDLLFGLVTAELAWVGDHWLYAYPIPTTNLKIPQLAIITSIFAFALIKIYSSVSLNGGKFTASAITLPIAFSALLTIAIVVLFSNPVMGL